MSKYKVHFKVYLKGRDGTDEKFCFDNKEEIKKFLEESRNLINEYGERIYIRYRIMMDFEKTDIPISRGDFTDEEVIVEGLDDEWRIQGGCVINYTRFQRAQEEKVKGGDER